MPYPRNCVAVGVSVLCPLFVDTRIMEAARNRPAALQNEDGPARNALQMRDTTPAADEAERVLQAVLEERFYIFPHMDVVDENVKARFENILERRNPKPRAMR